MKSKLVLLVLIFLFASSAFGKSPKSNSPKVEDDLLGIDINRNNVRDDVEAYINTLKLSKKLKKSYINYAESEQLLFRNKDSVEMVNKYAEQMSSDRTCISFLEGSNTDHVLQKIRAMMRNNPIRIKASDEIDRKYISKSYKIVPIKEIGESKCRF